MKKKTSLREAYPWMMVSDETIREFAGCGLTLCEEYANGTEGLMRARLMLQMYSIQTGEPSAVMLVIGGELETDQQRQKVMTAAAAVVADMDLVPVIASFIAECWCTPDGWHGPAPHEGLLVATADLLAEHHYTHVMPVVRDVKGNFARHGKIQVRRDEGSERCDMLGYFYRAAIAQGLAQWVAAWDSGLVPKPTRCDYTDIARTRAAARDALRAAAQAKISNAEQN